ncbi:MAG: acyl-CoA thioesterase [Bacteroidales bacterium]|nr:acyl-CoA thioesterase [Bacteroidales bacterium]
MFVAESKWRVQYYETDQMGVVHHSNYIRYYEAGRTDAIRQLGFSYKSLEESGTFMPIVNVQSRYIKPAKYDEILTIKTMVKEMPTIKIIFYYEIYNEAHELINEGSTTLAFTDALTGRPKRASGTLAEKLKQYF